MSDNLGLCYAHVTYHEFLARAWKPCHLPTNLTAGLRRPLREDVLARDGTCWYTQQRFARPTAVAWTLLDDRDAQSIRSTLAAGPNSAVSVNCS
jgi:hypothetical protein